MLAIFKRELTSFFSSPTGYLVVGLFLVINGLFLWVFKGPFNIFDYGFADLSKLFLLAPWVFLFLIPAITMRSFSEERKLGTLELLFIKPLGVWNTVAGKFLGTLVLALIAIAPTVLYVFAISALGSTEGNLDIGLVLGSYFGLIFLIVAYTAIGLFASVITDNQIVAFLVGVLLCFAFYYGFEAVGTLFTSGSTALFIENFGMKSHFESMAAGVVNTKDLIYFASLAIFFLYTAVNHLNNLER
ncbi:gliding motility-associated ABC transporter permease subunit GldF [Muriicola sp. Z0-33]|uniref:gliding motility-associated ABC transporter permease subunit GldF n=1 Tax=Muriicola sp. Z0-33 TaxID=2816957 RepID=UPI0022380B9B|nr:gliding motility-associated ABC transporter permease subunit GldF [Muriicola sp. Z0-33]MCW5515558.1 gliding motility-associated ABC transporter permease subunit GldF [Muriicola sp. Z0-33]